MEAENLSTASLSEVEEMLWQNQTTLLHLATKKNKHWLFLQKCLEE